MVVMVDWWSGVGGRVSDDSVRSGEVPFRKAIVGVGNRGGVGDSSGGDSSRDFAESRDSPF